MKIIIKITSEDQVANLTMVKYHSEFVGMCQTICGLRQFGRPQHSFIHAMNISKEIIVN